ncbi:MAG: hypothetical protein ACU0BB_09440 [Paracoccaceae bacterium]
MKAGIFLATTLSLGLGLTTSAMATVACTATAKDPGTQSIPLYALPDAASDVIRNVPVGDLMLYPQQELAPQQSEDWIWVRHDISQEDIWQGGEFGWVRPDNLTICG